MFNQRWINLYIFHSRDGDGILDFLDNCPSYANGDQSDIDGDGVGKDN